MKERIRELMQQIGTDTSGKWINIENAEKLAELIVNECFVVVTRNPHIGTSLAGANMKKHFGVE